MGKMIKVDPSVCVKCKYHTGGVNDNRSYVCCYYYVLTGKRRGCKVGECDKFEEGKSMDKDI